MINNVKYMALIKITLPLQGMFFQGESPGVSPMEHCTHCKVCMAECRICSSEKALLTAEEEEEYNFLKEHVTLNEVTES